MRCFLVCLGLLASAAAFVEFGVGYYERVGIPQAARIKAAEDEMMARLAEDTVDPLADDRIVGGAVSASGAHPFLGGLLINLVTGGTSACGSSLISQTRLVTAAQCWFDGINQGWQLTVALGTNWLFYGGTRIVTNQVAMHPEWNIHTLANDVAIIYLPTTVWYSATIQPIALPSTSQLSETFVGEMAVAAGFGKTNDVQTGVTTNSVISQVNLQVISVAQCQATFGNWAQASNICINGAGGVGICGGDSGGPLYINRWGQHILVGISSFVAGNGCQLGFPSAFARITNFYNFIVQHM